MFQEYILCQRWLDSKMYCLLCFTRENKRQTYKDVSPTLTCNLSTKHKYTYLHGFHHFPETKFVKLSHRHKSADFFNKLRIQLSWNSMLLKFGCTYSMQYFVVRNFLKVNMHVIDSKAKVENMTLHYLVL